MGRVIHSAERSFGETVTPMEKRTAKPHQWYLYLITCLGVGVAALSSYSLLNGPAAPGWIALAALTAVGGCASVKIPGVKSKVSVSDVLVFLSIMIFGPAAGGLTAAVDGIAGTLRCKRPSRALRNILFNSAAMALAGYVAGETFMILRATSGPLTGGASFIPAFGLSLAYFLLNTGMVATMVGLESGANIARVWKQGFLGLLPSYLASGLGAALLALGGHVGPMVLGAVALMGATLYLAHKTAFQRIPA